MVVEDDVQQEPRGGRANEVESVAVEELIGKDAERVLGILQELLELLLLGLDFQLQDFLHVRGRLLCVLGDESHVVCGLGHFHAQVVGQHSEACHDHEKSIA